jgi:hypothetical protein
VSAAALLADDPAQASTPGGPHDWEPLLYLAYSRLDSTAVGHSTLEVARLLLASGADPNAGYLWEGTYARPAALGGEPGALLGDQAPGRTGRLAPDSLADRVGGRTGAGREVHPVAAEPGRAGGAISRRRA